MQSTLIDTSHYIDQLAICTKDFNLLTVAYSGGVAGGCRALSRIFTFPFDTMKTLEQSDATTRPKKVNYFRGVTVSVLSAIPANAVFFVIYYFLEHCYNHCGLTTAGMSTLADGTSTSTVLDAAQVMPHPSLLLRMLFSMIATVPQNLMKVPAELIKQRAQINPDIPIVDLIQQATSTEIGWKGLYVGSGAQLLRELPYNAFQMAIYEYLEDQHFAGLSAVDKREVAAGLGLFASSIAAVLTQPSDVLKTVLMTTSPSTTKQNVGLLDRIPIIAAGKEVYQKTGFIGFFAGLLPRLTIVSVGGTVYFFAAEYVKEALG